MKKIIITSILSSLICVASFGQSLYRTILSHNGQLTQFDINHWTEAISNAEEGDTVYFTSGYFPGDLTITKAITLIGVGIAQTETWFYNETSGIQNALAGCGISGMGTTLGGDIFIDIDGSVTFNKTMFEGLKMNKGLFVKEKPVHGIAVKRCHINNLDTDVSCSDWVIEDCGIINDFLLGNLATPVIRNCYITNARFENNPVTLTNCSINENFNMEGCTLENCILHNYYWYNGEWANDYVNCIYEQGKNKSENGSSYTDCYQYSGECAWNLTKEELETAGYLGNDGTVVGPLGGQAPFTFIPSQPYVSASTVAYDASTKKLNVNITVKKGK